MNILGYHFHSWKKVKNTGINMYYECSCGKRKVFTPPEGSGFGYQPIDDVWLKTGKWRGKGTPPNFKD
jgi:hypothetical protein